MENQLQDKTCQVVTKYCQSEWLDHSHTASCANCYYFVAIKLSVCNILLLRGARIVISQSLQQQMLAKLQYIVNTRVQPSVNKELVSLSGSLELIIAMISKCLNYCKYRSTMQSHQNQYNSQSIHDHK